MLWHLGGGGKRQDLYSIVPALSEIITGGKVVSTEPDKTRRPEVKSVHKIIVRVMLDGIAKDVIASIRETDECTFHYDLGRNISDGARSMLSGSGKATVRVGDAQVLGPALEVGPINVNLEFEPEGGNGFSRGRISAVQQLRVSIGHLGRNALLVKKKWEDWKWH